MMFNYWDIFDSFLRLSMNLSEHLENIFSSFFDKNEIQINSHLLSFSQSYESHLSELFISVIPTVFSLGYSPCHIFEIWTDERNFFCFELYEDFFNRRYKESK